MGRNRNRNRGPKHQGSGGGQRGNYQCGPKNNKDFEAYYKIQGIVAEDEWTDFLETLQKPLPSTFRLAGFKGQAKELLRMIKSEYLDDLINVEVDGRTIDPPKCLSWYPDDLAWQLDLDRKSIRQSAALKGLHNFLIQGTASGNISRQEAVSMIPPLVLDVQPQHKVLDMCAAPGSKTAQLIEMLHADETKIIPDGCVVANDSDNKRCYLMTHQVKRLETASFIVINQDATCMPNFKVPNEAGIMKSVKFDRILADVPCSGDGTMRKNIDAWGKWNVHTGMHLHNIQSRILSRGLEMLAVGGRLVYSTCSLNPIENEAVVSNMLRKSQGAVALVDVSDKLPGLKWVPGLSNWQVMSRELEKFDSVDDLPQRLTSTIRPSVFPPTPEEVDKFQLHKCMRLLPHHQDTGGFFVSVLEKTEELPWVKHTWVQDLPGKTAPSKKKTASEEDHSKDVAAVNDEEDTLSQDNISGETTPKAGDTPSQDNISGETPKGGDSDVQGAESVQTETDDAQTNKRRQEREHSPTPPSSKRQKKQFGYKEDPFIYINQDDPIWPSIQEFYGLKDFPVDQLLVRCIEGKKRNIYFTSPIVKTLLTHNEDRMKFINLGVKILSRSDSPHVSCPFRTVQDGINILNQYVSKRVCLITKEDIVTLLSTEMPFLCKFSKTMQDQFCGVNQGSVIFIYEPDDRPDSPKCRMILCGWLGKTSCRSFIPLNDRGHFLRLCGAELKTKESKRQQTATGDGDGNDEKLNVTETTSSQIDDVDDEAMSKSSEHDPEEDIDELSEKIKTEEKNNLRSKEQEINKSCDSLNMDSKADSQEFTNQTKPVKEKEFF